jgi:CRP-like cAMP-binding protein
LASFFKLVPKLSGTIVFDQGDQGDILYVVLSGEVILYKPSKEWLELTKEEKNLIKNPKLIFGHGRERIQSARYGSMIGDLTFALQERRSFAGLTDRDTILFSLSRQKFTQLEVTDPILAVGLYKMIGRSLGMTLSCFEQLKVDGEEV